MYKLPLNFQEIIENNAPKVDLRTSVCQNIKFILTTNPLELAYDAQFGCILNQYQFVSGLSTHSKKLRTLEKQAKGNITMLLQKFEPRLEIKDVQVALKTAVHEKIPVLLANIAVTGQLRKQPFQYPDNQLDTNENWLPLIIQIQ
jgi:predicted component of type VI protein secretion system